MHSTTILIFHDDSFLKKTPFILHNGNLDKSAWIESFPICTLQMKESETTFEQMPGLPPLPETAGPGRDGNYIAVFVPAVQPAS